MQRIAAILFSALLAGGTWSFGQEESKSPPPPPPPGGKEGRRFGALGIPPFGRGPGGPEGADFSSLSEAEKKKVREALDAAWRDPEVESARDRVMKANEDFRKAMHAAVERKDPEAAKILAKVRPPSPWDMLKDRVRLPPPDDPKFVELAIMRVGMELYHMAKPEHREAARRLHDRVLKHPSVVAAIEAMKNASGEARMAAFKAFGEEYKKQVDAEVKDIRSKMAPPPPPSSEKP